MEGSGKSTLLAGLADRLRAGRRDVVATREPGGTELGNRVRALFVDPGADIDALAEAFLVNASRAQHVREVVEPALRAGRWVLCDRFVAATLAYQGYGRGLDLATLGELARVATGGLAADVTLLVDVPVELSRERVVARSRAGGPAVDRLEREGRAFHERVRGGYLALARSDPAFVVLDGSLSVPLVLETATTALAAKLAE